MSEKIIIREENLEEEESRFSRFELISWWDQDVLKDAKVLVIGAGALGNEILKNLALLGVGNVLIADLDRIENSNLSRSCLYRKEDNGKFKSEVAATATKNIYPDINIQPFVGNIVHDLGRGVYDWADIIIGGLDNREARLSINTNSLFVGKAWIDGAIEVLNGVARMFQPGDEACYECTMSEVDWKMLEARRSCALLSREEMNSGKTPTTPTTGSIIAGIQVQEAVKYLHGMGTMNGEGYVFNGLTGESYNVKYTRKENCCAHDSCGKLIKTGKGCAEIKVGELLKDAREKLGEDAVIDLKRDIISELSCMSCGNREAVFSSLGKITEKHGKCPDCGNMRAPETLSTLGYDDSLDDKTFAELGIPPYDIVSARSGENVCSFIFDGDAEEVLGPLKGN